ncbi:multidrug effflux MFS transporter [Aminobacter sp. AP02]|uniref:multidrug effflux MFS transporter n=1 Tax=Aminobacter sp. AP02 TaxID=2135737 RepID=UPI000D6CDE18|nr:multidrug effflux MFS transporter [Aminobacter sp. AP02]PWK76266.1 DHA1 family bicyclomycin/chloramphenicol resistance-like MFS transporter [Aminobacter sp. AP02]
MNMRTDIAMAEPLEVTATPIMSERRVSVIGGLMVAIGPISLALFTPAMPEIVQAFGTTEAAVKMTLSLYFGGFAFAQLICGPLSDGFGRRPITLVFMAIYLAASVLALMAPNIETLVAARFLQGVGAAVGVSVARAVVRDVFTHERSARIMNMIGILLALGPAIAPTLGGLTMEFFGWHAIFIVMVLLGIVVMLVAMFVLRETVTRDLSRIRPTALITSYGSLFRSPYFVLCCLVIAGTTGAIYTQATVLAFILMERVGLTPTQFGIGMLMQTANFMAGAVVMRMLMPRFGAVCMVPVGLTFVAIGAISMAILLRTYEPTFLLVMVPVGTYAFGIAMVTPAMMTAAMAPFPKNAGAASSMMGFFQMGAGMVGGAVAAWMGDPVNALATVIPAMGLVAIVSWLIWRRLPEPSLMTRLK